MSLTARAIFTIGHSSHPLARLAALLGEHGVTQVADVRRWPRSLRHPHFDDDALAVELAPHGVAYAHLAGSEATATRSRGPAMTAGRCRPSTATPTI